MNEKNLFKLFIVNLKNIAVSKTVCYVFLIMTFLIMDVVPIAVVLQIALILLYLSFVYTAMRREGAHDRNFVQMGKMKKDLLKPFAAGAMIAAPSFISWILLIVFKITGSFPLYYGVFTIFNAQYYPIYFWIHKGFKITGMPNSLIIVAFFLMLLLPASSFFGYYFGFNDISPMRNILYKKDQE